MPTYQDALSAEPSAFVGRASARTAAGSLSATGAQMLAQCTALKFADAALKAAGFDVQPAPLVTLGALQRRAIAMAGPFGALLEAALQAQAAAGTIELQARLSLVNAADAAAGAALSTAEKDGLKGSLGCGWGLARLEGDDNPYA